MAFIPILGGLSSLAHERKLGQRQDLILLVHSLQPYEELRDLTEVWSKKSATLELGNRQ